MKKRKFNSINISNWATGNKKTRRKKMEEDNYEDLEADERAEIINNVTKKAKGRGPPFSQQEEMYIATQSSIVSEGSEIVTHDHLARVAKRCNNKFFEGKKVRTGEGLWWRIKREQAKGNECYSEIIIQGGSPKYKKINPQYSEGFKSTHQHHAQDKQVVTRAIKMPPRPQTPRLPQGRSVKPQSAPNGKNKPIEILIKDSTGNIQKVFTTKYKNVEEFLFSLV